MPYGKPVNKIRWLAAAADGRVVQARFRGLLSLWNLLTGPLNADLMAFTWKGTGMARLQAEMRNSH